MSEAQPSTRPRILGPLLVALVFLAVIGGSLGFILGSRDGDAGSRPSSPSSSSPPPPSSSSSGVRCLAHTEEMAGRELTQVLYVRTEESEAWVCVDSGGRLFYQGHAGQPGEDLVDGVNALFLTDVEQTGAGYRARNTSGESTTEYLVSSRELVIRQPDGTAETQPAVPS